MGMLTTSFEQWIAASAGWAPVAVFVITFLESLPGISLLVPATAMLLVVGALLGAGTIDPVPVLLAATGGAIIGDAIGFWASRALGPQVVRRWLPRSQRRAYARALLLFRRWGWAAVFVGRFLGPVRAVAPLMAGVARMREHRFQTANIASAIVWAPAMLLPGYAAARGLDGVDVSPGFAGLLVVALLAATAWWVLPRRA